MLQRLADLSSAMVFRLITVVMLSVILAACGGGSDDAAEDMSPSSQPETSSEQSSPVTSEPERVGEPDDCLVAASKWADRMTDHVLDAATTAPAFGEMLDIDDLDDPSSEIKVLCSEAISSPVLDGNAKIAEVNFELSLCAFEGECDAPATKKIRRLAEEAASYVGAVRQQF